MRHAVTPCMQSHRACSHTVHASVEQLYYPVTYNNEDTWTFITKEKWHLIIDYSTGATAKYITVCFNLLAKMHSVVQQKTPNLACSQIPVTATYTKHSLISI